MNSLRVRRVLVPTLTLFLGLHIFRVFLPSVLWYLGQFTIAEGLALYGLATFSLALLAPLVRKLFGPRGTLALTVGGLALARLGIQVARTPLADLALSTAGLALLGWFLPVWCQSKRNCPDRGQVPTLAVAFPLAFLIDTGCRSSLLSYDLAWRNSLWATTVVAGLVVVALLLLRQELKESADGSPLDHRIEEPTLSCVLPLIGLGPWLYVAMAVTHNPSALVAATGWKYGPAHLTVNGFSALGAIVALLVAGFSALQRWYLALLGGALLTASLAFFVQGVGPAWLWVGLASINSWAALGEVLTSTARTEPLQPGLWRTAVITFLALATLLAIVVMVMGYDMLWVTWVAGLILMLAALWATRVEAGRDRDVLRDRIALVGTAAVGVLLAVALWALLSRPPETVEVPQAGEPLRVMTYNIHQGLDTDFRMDLEAIADVIVAENPDVVILNEVNLARANNGYVDTLLLISRRQRMPYIFGANREDRQYGNAILSRYPILTWDNTHYARKTTETRGLLRAAVQADGEPITFYATHLDHLSGPNHVRAEQVAEAMAKWADTPRAVLLGDLNADPDAPELQSIYEAGFVDVLAATGLGDAFTSWDPDPLRRIDFIFVTPDLSPIRSWVVPSRASDHLPVLAEIRP